MQFDQISPQLFVGSCPEDSGDVDHLADQAGISAVLNVQTDEDFDDWDINWPALESHYRTRQVEVCRVPIRDFSPESLRLRLPAGVDALAGLIERRHKVLVHCNAGINRSPSTVIAYLHWVEQWDLDEAVAHVTRCRACDPYLESIRLATEDRRRQPG